MMPSWCLLTASRIEMMLYRLQSMWRETGGIVFPSALSLLPSSNLKLQFGPIICQTQIHVTPRLELFPANQVWEIVSRDISASFESANQRPRLAPLHLFLLLPGLLLSLSPLSPFASLPSLTSSLVPLSPLSSSSLVQATPTTKPPFCFFLRRRVSLSWTKKSFVFFDGKFRCFDPISRRRGILDQVTIFLASRLRHSRHMWRPFYAVDGHSWTSPTASLTYP